MPSPPTTRPSINHRNSAHATEPGMTDLISLVRDNLSTAALIKQQEIEVNFPENSFVPMADQCHRFGPVRLGSAECAAWVAYYWRTWPKVLTGVLGMVRTRVRSGPSETSSGPGTGRGTGRSSGQPVRIRLQRRSRGCTPRRSPPSPGSRPLRHLGRGRLPAGRPDPGGPSVRCQLTRTPLCGRESRMGVCVESDFRLLKNRPCRLRGAAYVDRGADFRIGRGDRSPASGSDCR